MSDDDGASLPDGGNRHGRPKLAGFQELNPDSPENRESMPVPHPWVSEQTPCHVPKRNKTEEEKKLSQGCRRLTLIGRVGGTHLRPQ